MLFLSAGNTVRGTIIGFQPAGKNGRIGDCRFPRRSYFPGAAFIASDVDKPGLTDWFFRL
jgi:hypothetical protein